LSHFIKYIVLQQGVATPCDATIEIFDLNGKIVGAGLAPAQKEGDRKGRPYIRSPDNSIPSGVYLVRATIGDRTLTKRAELVR
jgi:hypothetical protein